MKVLHVLETSIPHTAGYTIRARAIVEYQRRIGIEPVVVTSPLFRSEDAAVVLENYDGVRYYRTNAIAAPSTARSKLSSYAVRIAMLARYRRAVLEIARSEGIEVIHAHSSYTNAYAGLPAARRLALPMIYEVRTLWGESAVVEDGLRSNSWKHKLIWRLELNAMRQADLVVPIARGIREELVRRGIAPKKLRVVPNGVDSMRFVPLPRDEARAHSAGLSGCFIIGYVGSIRRLEGLSTLLSACGICQSQQRRVGLVVVGDGPDKKALQSQALRQGLVRAIFTGNLPHAEVASWYSLMDVLVYPRVRAVINERVTPLKPLEAMAQGKVCVASDVGGLMELIADGETGVIFRSGDTQELAEVLMGLMDNPAKMDGLRQRALDFVRKERDWSKIVPRYRELYDEVLLRKKAGGPAGGMNGRIVNSEAVEPQ